MNGQVRRVWACVEPVALACHAILYYVTHRDQIGTARS
jgi:hypothetical protein